MEQTGEQTTYRQLVTKHNGMKIILEFPDKTDREKNIGQEIKSALLSVLWEQSTPPQETTERPAKKMIRTSGDIQEGWKKFR